MNETYLELSLPEGMSAPHKAREAVRAALSSWGLPHDELVSLGEMIVTELVTNAVRHAGGHAVLCMSADGNTVTLSVHDESPAPPASREPDDYGGRGLHVVEALSTSYGYQQYPEDGKSVWAQLCAPLPRPEQHRIR
jgi:two-component sensor histidine kinase